MGNDHADNADRSALEDSTQELIPLSRSDAARIFFVLAGDIKLTVWNPQSFQH